MRATGGAAVALAKADGLQPLGQDRTVGFPPPWRIHPGHCVTVEMMDRRAGAGLLLAVMSGVGAFVLAGGVRLQGGAQSTGTISGIVTTDHPPLSSTVAVNADQVAEFELPTRPDRTGAASVQAEALPPVLMRRLLRDAILEYLPAGQLEHAERETEAGIDRLRGAFIPHGEQSS